MRRHPKYAQALVRFYLAKCWMWVGDDGLPVLDGVHFWDNWLLSVSIWFHSYFVEPFRTENSPVGYPVDIIEVFDKSIEEYLRVSMYISL